MLHCIRFILFFVTVEHLCAGNFHENGKLRYHLRLAVGKRLLPNNKIGLDGCLLGLLDRYPLG